MRCKEGDLVVVSSVNSKECFAENIGRFGTVTKILPPDFPPGWWVMPQNKFFAWETEAGGKFGEYAAEISFADTSLTPIRPGDLLEDTETAKELEQA